MGNKLREISLNAIPILLMLALIPLVTNDYLLTGIYVAIIAVALKVKRDPEDFNVLVFGFFTMLIAEYLMVKTGAETFSRRSLWNAMPLWLPFLWAYGFVAIKRGVRILNE